MKSWIKGLKQAGIGISPGICNLESESDFFLRDQKIFAGSGIKFSLFFRSGIKLLIVFEIRDQNFG